MDEPSPTLLTPVRRAIAGALRERVSGRPGALTEAELAGDGRPGWFGPRSTTWLVHSDAAMFVGGVRALLLQSMHPLAMAGVAEHSDYRHDPWGRLQRTARFLARTTYGSAEVAAAACAEVRAVHDHVRGIAADGRPYEATDPHLLLWVHLSEVESFALAYQRYGSGERLDDAGRDTYVAEMARVAAALGVVDPPTTWAGVQRALRSYQPELRATPAARDAARFLLNPPDLPLVARPAYAVLAAAAIGMLPWWNRLALRLPPPLPITERLLVPAAMRTVLDVIRWALAGDDRASVAARVRSASSPAPTVR